jgi:hypothetical protein
MKYLIQLIFIFVGLSLQAQTSLTGILSTNTTAEKVLQGNYNPNTYKASTVLNRPDTLSAGLAARTSADSLKNTILKLATFHNRNTGSDTVSTLSGFGAARRWVFSQLNRYSSQNQNRLLVSYLQFTATPAICGATH